MTKNSLLSKQISKHWTKNVLSTELRSQASKYWTKELTVASLVPKHLQGSWENEKNYAEM